MLERLFPLIVLTVVAAGCGGASSANTGDAVARRARVVRVAGVAEQVLSRVVTVSGTLAAEEEAVLSVKVAGRLASMDVDIGSAVRRGQPIARIDPTDYDLRVTQAQAALRQARARLGLPIDGDDDHVEPAETGVVRQAQAVLDEARLTRDRVATFVRRGISSRAELDSAEAAFEVADSRYQDAVEEVRNRQAIVAERRSELELARQQLESTVLRAPFDGRIRERPGAVGQYVAAGTPIATIVRVHPLRLRLEVPEREAPGVRLGQPVRVTVEGDQASYEGRLARISPSISVDNRTLLVEAEIPNDPPRLRPGSFARAEIVVDASASALTVPAASVVSFAGVDKVFTVEGGKAAERRVQLGRRAGPLVEVVEGVKAGERVVVEPGSLVAGETVRLETP